MSYFEVEIVSSNDGNSMCDEKEENPQWKAS